MMRVRMMFTRPPACRGARPSFRPPESGRGAWRRHRTGGQEAGERHADLHGGEGKVFGSRAILATLAPRASSCSICSICEPREDQCQLSVPENTEPMEPGRMFKPVTWLQLWGARQIGVCWLGSKLGKGKGTLIITAADVSTGVSVCVARLRRCRMRPRWTAY